jgi:signal recognition particle subunit SRP54
MTPLERSTPSILNGSRRQRIATGSGTNVTEVNKLVKQFDETRKMMRTLTTAKPGKKLPAFKK